jgi:uncharacterized protein (DUF433 family)
MSRPPVQVQHPHVCCDPLKFGGSPHITGTGVLVRRLWAWHRGGASVETLLRRYPRLGPALVLDALSYAYDNQALIEDDLRRERELLESERHTGVGLRPVEQQDLPFLSGRGGR